MAQPSCLLLPLVGSVACSLDCPTRSRPMGCRPLPKALSVARAGLASKAVPVALVPMALCDGPRCSRCTGCTDNLPGVGARSVRNTPGTCSTNRLVLHGHCLVLAVALCTARGPVLWPLACLGPSPSVVVSSASALLEAGVWERSLLAEAAAS